MTALPDFLLARIAEDEEVAPYVHHENCDSLDSSSCDCVWPERIKAEREAQRRIVEEHSEDGGWGEESGACVTCNRARFPCQTLRALALPYADHPDYDEAWRP